MNSNANIGLFGGFCTTVFSISAMYMADTIDYTIFYAIAAVLGGVIMLISHLAGDR
jgi:hypothetical protein